MTDLEQIVAATHTYALGLDLFDPQIALSAYTDDAYWDATAVGLKRFEGADEILASASPWKKPIAEQFHVITNHLVSFDDEDTYRRVDGTWKISGRAISPLTTPQMEGFDA
jgi:hypothetical protein